MEFHKITWLASVRLTVIQKNMKFTIIINTIITIYETLQSGELHIQEVLCSDLNLKTNCHDQDCTSNYVTVISTFFPGHCSLITLSFGGIQPAGMSLQLCGSHCHGRENGIGGDSIGESSNQATLSEDCNKPGN
jgi:hypothetical protein